MENPKDFEVNADGVLHIPTKARYIPALAKDDAGSWEDGTLGTPLAADHDTATIKKTMLHFEVVPLPETAG